MCFNFQNMAVLCDNNAEQSKFRFSRSPCGDARYLVIPCTYLFAVSSKIFFLGPGHTVPCLPTHLSMLYRRGNLDAIEEICNKILRFLSIQKNIILPPCIACNIVKNTTLSYVSRNLGDRGNAL